VKFIVKWWPTDHVEIIEAKNPIGARRKAIKMNTKGWGAVYSIKLTN